MEVLMIQVIFRTQKVYLLIFLNHYAILSLLKKYQAESIIISDHTHTHTHTHTQIHTKALEIREYPGPYS